MKKLLLTLSALSCAASMAAPLKVERDDLLITSVKIDSPLPTGLESVTPAAQKMNELYAAIRKDSRVLPFVSAAEKYYLTEEETAKKNGNNAFVQVNCKSQPTIYLKTDSSFCAFTATKTYGWYADLTLSIQIDGFVKKTIADEYKKSLPQPRD